MSFGDTTKPTRVEALLESRFPGYHFGTVLVLLVLTFLLLAVGPPDAWARVLTVTLQSLTLMAALLASRSGRRLFRVAALVVVIAVVSSVLSVILSSSSEPTGIFFALNVLLVGAAPFAIAVSVYRRQIVDIHTVLGAICIYVLLGMVFAFLYAAVDALGPDPFFVQTHHATLPLFLYFSFTTQATVGYGDYTAATNLGHTLAVLDALIGQLYLVTVLALLVSRLAITRAAPARTPTESRVTTARDNS